MLKLFTRRLFFVLVITCLLFGEFPFFLTPDKVNAVSETRYMRSDTQTVNGLLAYQLGTSQTASGLNTLYRVTGVGNGDLTVYWGIRVWKRTSGGTETEITSGTPVAQVTRTTSASGIQSATWNAPSTTLNTTDSIVVRVYIQVGVSGWVQGGTAPNFTTGQLGNTNLDAATWTVYYYTVRTNNNTGPGGSRWTQGDFSWGTSTFDSRITNFTYSSPVITVGTTGTQRTNLHPGSTDEYLGGAFTLIRNNTTANVTSITISQTGSVTSANLTDLILYYKQEASCSTSIPGDATQFNSTPGTFSGGSSTVTGTISVGTSQICVYVRIDVGAGASPSETIDFQITNPSTQVIVSAGGVTPATAVAISGTTTITAGSLSLSIVDASDVVVSSPSVAFGSKTFSFAAQQSTGTLGVSAQKIKVGNYSASHTWTLSIAATGGNTSLWQAGSYTYDYNGSAAQGRLQVDPSVATITPGSGCSNNAINLQSSAYFAQGTLDSINLVIAGSTGQTDCYWYVTGIGLTQDIPAAQQGGNYSISMTLTLL